MCILACNIGFGLYSTIGDLIRRYKRKGAQKNQISSEDQTNSVSSETPIQVERIKTGRPGVSGKTQLPAHVSPSSGVLGVELPSKAKSSAAAGQETHQRPSHHQKKNTVLALPSKHNSDEIPNVGNVSNHGVNRSDSSAVLLNKQSRPPANKVNLVARLRRKIRHQIEPSIASALQAKA